MSDEHPFAAIEESFKKSVALLDGAGIQFLLGGSLAIWAHGGSETRNDLDFIVRPEDAERALDALTSGGMRPERPPEEWLLKAWDGGVLVDLIHHPRGIDVTEELIARGPVRSVAAMEVRVMAIEDVLTSKLLALGEHSLDYEPCLQISRSLREMFDWSEVRARTARSPYARAFFFLAEQLNVTEEPARPATATSHPRVRVVE
jgi:Nucleotidyl transferase of unknown function (DUF2204)